MEQNQGFRCITVMIAKSLFFIVLFTFGCSEILPQSDTAAYLKNPNYKYELEFYKIYKKKRADVVLLGNSITHGVNWNELLGRDNVVERGIPSDNLEGIFNRLEFVVSLKPKLCLIKAGINDIYSWIPVETVFANYKKVMEELKKNNIRVIVQSTLYVSQKYTAASDRNNEVKKLNVLLEDYCRQNGLDFIDLNAKLSRSFALKDELTHDGVHLNAGGYKLWGEEVNKILLKYGY